MFIKLTRFDDKKVRIHVERVGHYYLIDDGETWVEGLKKTVKETPEEIDKLLIESHIFIKEIL